MEAKWIHKLYRQGTGLVVVIPSVLVRSFGLQKGDAVVMFGTSGEVITMQSLASYLASFPQNQKPKEIIKLR